MSAPKKQRGLTFTNSVVDYKLLENAMTLEEQISNKCIPRRTCATLLLENGMPLTTVMQMLGWTNVDTAMKYDQTSTEAVN